MGTSTKLRLGFLGGLGQIGMNCLALEYQDELMVIDCGLYFTDLDQFGVEFAIPNMDYLIERKDKLKAFVLTHGHEDHIGALVYALKQGLDAPIYGTHFTLLLVRERLKEAGLFEDADLRTLKPGEVVKFKQFQFHAEKVNHSIVDATALFIQTPAGKVIHTGDFKIDPSPHFGEPLNLEPFKKWGDEGVLLLLSDSTNVERESQSLSESEVKHKLEQAFASAEGLTIVSLFASNVARVSQVFELAEKMGKKIALSGRTMEQNVRLAEESGYLRNTAMKVISIDEINDFPRKDVLVLSTGSQGEYRSSLMRISRGEHRTIEIEPGDRVVMSSKFIPGNEVAIGHMINDLFKQGADVLYEAIADIHSSGHATRPELQTMLEAVKPKFFIPIHGEYRHLVHHANLAKITGVKSERIRICVDGDIIDMDKDSWEMAEQREDTRVLIESREGVELTREVLKDRRKLAENGAVFVLCAIDRGRGKIIGGPTVHLKGLIREEDEGWLIEEATVHARGLIQSWLRSNREDESNIEDLRETVRIGVRQFFHSNIGKKPVTIVSIL